MKEGGVEVFERVPLRDSRYVDQRGNIRIPVQLGHSPGNELLSLSAKPDDTFAVRYDLSVIRAKDPRVARTDVTLIRTSDGKVLGRSTSFVRVGGDVVVVDSESRFRCPTDSDEVQLYRQVFIVDSKKKEE